MAKPVLVMVRGRTIYASGTVDEAMAHEVIIALEKLDACVGEIRIVFNSDGGDEVCGYAIYDAITFCRNTVQIDGYGAVQSIAAAILQAADKRRLAPSASFMIHNGQTPISHEKGQASQDHVIALAEQLRKDNQRYYNILSKGSQQPVDIVEAWCTEETYLTAEEAVERGFADEVIKPLKDRAKRNRRKRK